MCQVIDSDAVLAIVLSQRDAVDMAFLRDLRRNLCPDFYLDIDSESVASAVYLNAALFAWEREGVVRQAGNAQSLFASQKYIDASYGSRVPQECRRRIEERMQQMT